MSGAASVAAKALSLGFNPRQLQDMVRVSEKLSDVFQFEMAEGVDQLSNAIASGITITLKRNLGIMLDLTTIYKDYAKQLGVNVTQLSEAQKFQARYNATIAEAIKKSDELGATVDTVKDKMDRFKVSVADAQLFMGQLSIRFFGLVESILAAIAGVIERSFALLLKPFAWLENQLERFGVTITDRFFNEWEFKLDKNAEIMFAKVKEGWAIFTASIEDLAAGSRGAAAVIAEENALNEEQITIKLREELQKRLDAYTDAFNKQKEIGRQRAAAEEQLNKWLGDLFLDDFERRREDARLEYERLKKELGDKVELYVAYREALRQIDEDEKKDKEERRREDRIREFEHWDANVAIVQDAVGSFAGLFQTLAQIRGKHQKAAFAAFKVFAIAEAVIDAHRSYMRALATLNPPFSWIAAAAAFATGLARVAAIAATQPGGGATAVGGAAPAAPVPTAPAQPAAPSGPQIINVHVAGSLVSLDELGRSLVPVLRKAVSDGVTG